MNSSHCSFSISAFMFWASVPSYVILPSACVNATQVRENSFYRLARCLALPLQSVNLKMKNLQTWWKSLGEVEKTSVANVETLLETAESAILNEVSAWKAVGTTNKKNLH